MMPAKSGEEPVKKKSMTPKVSAGVAAKLSEIEGLKKQVPGKPAADRLRDFGEGIQDRLSSMMKPKEEIDPEVLKLRNDLSDLDLVPKNAHKRNLGISAELIIKALNTGRFDLVSLEIARAAIAIVGEAFDPMIRAMASADFEESKEGYVGKMLELSLITSFLSAVAVLMNAAVLKQEFLLFVGEIFLVPLLVFVLTATAFYAYPIVLANEKKNSINANLPFAVNHLAAIASSGAPPENAFKMMSQFEEYGAVSREAKNITRRIEIQGEDITTAMRAVIASTPSEPLKEILVGMLTVIESGGNLKDYLMEMAEVSLFNYRLARQRYAQTVSTYADMYTAILIVAPLFLVAILAVMNIIPGSEIGGGISINTAMSIGVYVLIPGLNVLFLAFVTLTQPEV